MIRDFARITIVLFAAMGAFHCASLNGGGSDVGNGIVIGSLVGTDGAPAAHAEVKLIPCLFNPVTDPPLDPDYFETTDEDGIYAFHIPTNGMYNIEAKSADAGARALIRDVAVRLGDTTMVLGATLKSPGLITVILPDSIDTSEGYLYIQGTMQHVSLSKAMHLPEGGFIITLDSVPEATIAAINYGILNTSLRPVLISDTVNVISNNTTIAEAFTYWRHYTAENSGLPGNSICDIHVLPDGSRWFATAGSGVARLNVNTWTTYDMTNSPLPSNDVYDIGDENNGTVWFATRGGVAALGADQWVVYSTGSAGLPSNAVTEVKIDRKGRKWLGTADAGLISYDGLNWTVYDTANSDLPSNDVAHFEFESDPLSETGENIWCATLRGAARFNSNTWKIYDAANSGILSDMVYCVAIDSRGDKWFGHEGGVSRFNGTAWETYDSVSSAMFAAPVTAIAEDNKGNIWFGTLKGLTKYTGSQWIDFTGERYRLLENASISALFIDGGNNVWIGTTNTGVILFGPNVHYYENRGIFDRVGAGPIIQAKGTTID